MLLLRWWIVGLSASKLYSLTIGEEFAATGRVNLVWSSAGDKLYFNYTAFSDSTPKNVGSFQYIIAKNILLPLPVTNGSAIEACLPTGHIVLSDATTYYVVDFLFTGRQEYTLKGVKSSFSPNGKKVLYYRDTNHSIGQGHSKKIPALFVADFNGKNEREAIGSYATTRCILAAR